MLGSHAVNDCRESRSSRFTLTLPHLCLHTLTPHISLCYDPCVCMHCVLQGQSMHRTSLSVLGRFLFGECELLCFTVFALQPFQCSWSHVFDMDPIADAPRHCAYSVLGFSSRSIKKLKTLLEHAMNTACGLSQPHLSTRLCNSSLCVSNALFRNCFGVYRHYANQLWSFQ